MRAGVSKYETDKQSDAPSSALQKRGRYFTLQQAADVYPAFTFRLLRRLTQERRIPFSRVGRCIVLAESDIEAYIEEGRVEPPKSCRHWGVAS